MISMLTRWRMVATATATAAVLVAAPGAPGAAAALDSGRGADTAGRIVQPVKTTNADWTGVAAALGRRGMLNRAGTVYRVGFPRSDLAVTSHGVRIKPGFALGGYATFARYPDGRALTMGDLVVAETELPKVTDALQAAGLDLTALHKHLLAQTPPVWWTHFHGIGRDPVALARKVRAVLNETATPPPARPSPSGRIDLDTAGIDAAMGTKGTNDHGIYRFTFAHGRTVSERGLALQAAMGVSTAINFQPTGGGKAAVNGDLVMTAGEVQQVVRALRRGGIQIVELHNHLLDDQPRLFYMHFWADDDAVALAKTLAEAVKATDVTPAG